MNQGNPIEEHLLLRYLLGQTDDNERSLVEEWLRESEENRSELDRLESLWFQTGKIDPPPLAVDIDAAWNKTLIKMKSHDGAGTRPLLSRTFLRIAAAIAIIAGIYALIRLITPDRETVLFSAGTILYDTLPDGSTVIMNRNSRLTFAENFSGDTREVSLEGEALFKVSKDPSRSFIVDAGIAKAKVLGTVFSVSRTTDGTVTVNVDEGLVLLFTVDPKNGDTNAIEIVPGTGGRVIPGNLIPSAIEEREADAFFWADQSLEFNAMPLSGVFKVLERCYRITIRAENSSILQCRLSASFSSEPAETILKVIAESFGLRLTTVNNVYLVSGDGCPK